MLAFDQALNHFCCPAAVPRRFGYLNADKLGQTVSVSILFELSPSRVAVSHGDGIGAVTWLKPYLGFDSNVSTC